MVKANFDLILHSMTLFAEKEEWGVVHGLNLALFSPIKSFKPNGHFHHMSPFTFRSNDLSLTSEMYHIRWNDVKRQTCFIIKT